MNPALNPDAFGPLDREVYTQLQEAYETYDLEKVKEVIGSMKFLEDEIRLVRSWNNGY
jgi:hypothetical protein